MLELKGISRSYGRVQALRGLDLTVPDGTLVGHLLPAVDAGLARYAVRSSRGNR